MSRPPTRAARFALSALRRRLARMLERPAPVSVIVVVTDDNAVLLEQCLASLEAPAEVVLVVTGTGDDTRRTVARATGRAKRVRSLELPDATESSAANHGAAAAAQPYLIFVDAGDLVRPGALRSVVATLKASGSDLAVADQADRATGRTLVSAPGVLGSPALADRVFRTSLWSGGPRLAEEPLDDWLPAVDAHLRANRFDTVTDGVRRGLVRGTGLAFGAMPVLAPSALRFVAAVDAALERLGSAELSPARTALVGWLVESELPRYLDDAERATAIEWEALVDLAGRLREAAQTSAAWDAVVGVESRLRVALAAEGRRRDLEEYAAARWHREGQYPTEVSEGTVSAVVPVSDVDRWRVLAPRETALSCSLRALRRVASGELEIEVAAWICGVGFQHGPAEAFVELVGPSGQRVVARVTQHREAELNQVGAERFQDHSGGLWRARVDADALTKVGGWLVELRLAVAGVSRSGRLALPGLERTLTSEPARPRLVDVRLDGGDLLLELADASYARVQLQGPRATIESGPAQGPRRLRLEQESWGLGLAPIPTGSYRLSTGTRPMPLVVDESLVARLPLIQRSEVYRLVVRRAENASAVIGLHPPLADDELGPFAQEGLQRWYASDEHRLDPRAVYLQSYTGQSATDSPRAIHEELRRARPDLNLTWAIADRSVSIPDGAAAVVIRSREWYQALARSSYIVTNVDLDWWFAKRPGQSVLQTFHGYPSKTMGLGAWQAKNFTPRRVERLLRRTSGTWDLLLTPSPAMEVHYREQYRYDGPILSHGYPRDDVLVAGSSAAVRVAARARLGISDGQRAVLYAPTWRDDLATDYRAAPLATGLDVGRLARALGSDHVILLRGHRFHRQRPELAGTRVVDCTDYPEVNDLILAADAAVFDYSSMRFDFALTGRPMVFHVPDLGRYVGKVRGFLYDFAETAPGPLATTTEEVIEALRDLGAVASSYADHYRRFNRTYNGEQDGLSAELAVRTFFGPSPERPFRSGLPG